MHARRHAPSTWRVPSTCVPSTRAPSTRAVSTWQVAAELGIQSDGLSVERWSCGGQFLVDVIGRWVFGPSFWIKEHLWRLPDGPSR